MDPRTRRCAKSRASFSPKRPPRLSSSYRGHYRRMLAPVLEALEFRSNNAAHRSVIEALGLLRRYAGSTAKSYPADEKVPIEGVVPPG